MSHPPVDLEAPPLAGPVLMHQQWRDLTFLHWAVDPARVAPLMPAGVVPHELDGRTYVGLIPFRMRDAGFGRRWPVPWAGTFLETNVRLYSLDPDGTPGIVFLSLDTDRALVVAGARSGFGVPYRWAQMTYAATPDGAGGTRTYTARLRWPARGPHADGVRTATQRTSTIRVRVGERREPDDLDTFLTARWGLHTRVLGRSLYVPNEHGPWPLHDAELLHLEDHLAASVGLGDVVTGPPDHLAFSPGVTTRFGLPRRSPRPGRPGRPDRRDRRAPSAPHGDR